MDELETLLSGQAEGITFVSGKGRRKTEEQRQWKPIILRKRLRST